MSACNGFLLRFPACVDHTNALRATQVSMPGVGFWLDSSFILQPFVSQNTEYNTMRNKTPINLLQRNCLVMKCSVCINLCMYLMIHLITFVMQPPVLSANKLLFVFSTRAILIYISSLNIVLILILSCVIYHKIKLIS